MKKFVAPFYPAVPFAAFLALAAKSAEMLLASGHVIGHRTGRMLKAGPMPNAIDRREFELMGREKIEAAMHSSRSMLSLSMALWSGMAGRMMASQVDLIAAFGSVASSRTPGQLAARQKKLFDAMADLPASPAQLAHTATRLARSGLGPIHSRAVANAKRLRKF